MGAQSEDMEPSSSVFKLHLLIEMLPPFWSQSDLARALIPRSVTVALALPISAQLEAPLAITAAAVLFQVRPAPLLYAFEISRA